MQGGVELPIQEIATPLDTLPEELRSRIEEMAVLSWDGLSEDALIRIVACLPVDSLSNLARTERRCRQPCTARLGTLMAPLLHDAARAGDAQRISSLSQRHFPVMLELDGRTILHTAIVNRRLDLVKWLTQTLNVYSQYSPLSSGFIAHREYGQHEDHRDAMVLPPLPD